MSRQYVGMQSIKRQTLSIATAAFLLSSLALSSPAGASPNNGGGAGGTTTECQTHCSYFVVYITINGFRFPVLKKVCSQVCF